MTVLQADKISVQQNGAPVLSNISFSMEAGEQWAVTGPSGSGKTTLLKAIAGRQFFTGKLILNGGNPSPRKRIVLVEQQHHFKTLSNTTSFYYQQRFNSQDAGDAITVQADLQNVLQKNIKAKDVLAELVTLFDIEKLYAEPLIQLSNGENKRLQIIKALLLQPAFLLLDNPFTGLDSASRQTLENVLHKIPQRGVHLIMVASAAHLPFFITNVLSIAPDGSYSAKAVSAMGPNESCNITGPSFSFDKNLLDQLQPLPGSVHSSTRCE